MNRKRNSLLLFLVAVFCHAQNTLYIDYGGFSADIMAYHPLSLKASNSKEIGKLQRQAAQGSYDPAINGSLQNKQFNGKNYYSRATVELKQPLFANQYLKMGYEYGEGLFLNSEFSTPENGLAFLGFEIGLLQGLTIDKRRSELLKSKAYLNYYDAESKDQFNELIFQSSQSYMYWLYAAKIQQLNVNFLQNAKQRALALQALAETGEKAPIDTVEAAMLYQSRQLDFQTASIELLKSEREVLSYVWTKEGPVSLDRNMNLRAKDSLENHYQSAQRKYAQLSFKNAQMNPQLAKYRAMREIVQVDARYRKELRKPALNVQYNLLSNVNSPAATLLANNYKWGLQLQMPLVRQTKNEYRISKTNFENLGLELNDKNNRMDAKLTALHQTLNLLADQIMLSERTVLYGQKMLEAEKWRFENGESSLFLLNTRENKWLESELKLAEYKLKFIMTVLQVVYLEGTLNYHN